MMDDTTPQQDYLASLGVWHRYPDVVERCKAGGPPPPLQADGIPGLVWWYEYHPPTADQYAMLLDRAVAADAITTADRTAFAELTPIEGVAAVRACLAMAASARKARAHG